MDSLSVGVLVHCRKRSAQYVSKLRLLKTIYSVKYVFWFIYTNDIYDIKSVQS